jgi:homoserine dehydrogenase
MAAHTATKPREARTDVTVEEITAAMQKAVNIALARHKALKQQVVVAGPDGQPRTVWVEELEAEAAARGEYLVYDVASPDGLAHPAA